MSETRNAIERIAKAHGTTAKFRKKLRSTIVIVGKEGNRVEHFDSHLGAGDVMHLLNTAAREVSDRISEKEK